MNFFRSGCGATSNQSGCGATSTQISKSTSTTYSCDGTCTTTEKIQYSDGRTVTKVTKSNGSNCPSSQGISNSTAPEILPEPVKTETPVNVGDFAKFEQEALAEHNRLRAKHGCAPLKLNRSLCAFSKEWAKHLASRNILQHRQNSKYGENLYMTSGGSINGATAVKSWYDEIKDYRFGYGGFSMSTGHFTQVVWKGSKDLGVAFETNGRGATYVVANYDPPGNYQGQFPANVPPLS